jgi:hypothetical protein
LPEKPQKPEEPGKGDKEPPLVVEVNLNLNNVTVFDDKGDKEKDDSISMGPLGGPLKPTDKKDEE